MPAEKNEYNSGIISILERVLTVEVRRVLSASQHPFRDDNIATAVWPAGELLSLKNPKSFFIVLCFLNN